MFCGNCGNKIVEGDRFCNTCGQVQRSSSASTTAPVLMKQLEAPDGESRAGEQKASEGIPVGPAAPTESAHPHFGPSRSEDGTLSAHIRESIASHKKTTEMLCLECGYSGLMGVIRTVTPWWARWPVMLGGVVVLALLFNYYVVIFGGVWGLGAAMAQR